MILAFGFAAPLYNSGQLVSIQLFFLVCSPGILALSFNMRGQRAIWSAAAFWLVGQALVNWDAGVGIISVPTIIGPLVVMTAYGLLWVHKRIGLTMQVIVVSMSIGWLGLELAVGHATSSTNPWKYGLGTPIIVLTLALLAFLHRARISSAATGASALAVVCLYFDSRIQAVLLILVAGMLLIFKRSATRRKRRGRMAVLCIAVACAYSVYPAVADAGLVGQRAQEQQVEYDASNVNYLLATRLELPQMAYLAVANLPLGVGSYGQVPQSQALGSLDFVSSAVGELTPAQTNYLLSAETKTVGYVPHSAAMATILYGGVFAIPFWLYYSSILVRAIPRLIISLGPVPAPTLFMFGIALWDIFFSPLSDRTHISMALALFLALATWTRSQERSIQIQPKNTVCRNK